MDNPQTSTTTEPIQKTEKELEEEMERWMALLGTHAFEPFDGHRDGARSLMFSANLAKVLKK